MSEEPARLIDVAESLAARVDGDRPGLWPRAAALLARQALESALEGYWQRRRLALEGHSMRAQLICLREYLREGDLASRVAHSWQALSHACHHHPYDLPPTPDEIRHWIAPVRELREVVLRD